MAYVDSVQIGDGAQHELKDSNAVHLTELLNKVYPIGAVYISVNSTSPATLFGGTWERIQDRFLLCAGTKYGAGSTGGSADAVVVSHNHLQNAHTHVQNAHNHTQDAHNHTQQAHNHTQNAHNHTQNAHNHTQNPHNHTQNPHNHTQNPHNHTQNEHRHQYEGREHVFTTATSVHAYNARLQDISGGAYRVPYIDRNLDKTFASSIGFLATAVNNPATAINIQTTATNIQATATNVQNTAVNNPATATNIQTTAVNNSATAVNRSTTATNQNTTAVNQATGVSGTGKNMPPYLGVYVWKRTA